MNKSQRLKLIQQENLKNEFKNFMEDQTNKSSSESPNLSVIEDCIDENFDKISNGEMRSKVPTYGSSDDPKSIKSPVLILKKSPQSEKLSSRNIRLN